MRILSNWGAKKEEERFYRIHIFKLCERNSLSILHSLLDISYNLGSQTYPSSNGNGGGGGNGIVGDGESPSPSVVF